LLRRERYKAYTEFPIERINTVPSGILCNKKITNDYGNRLINAS